MSTHTRRRFFILPSSPSREPMACGCSSSQMLAGLFSYGLSGVLCMMWGKRSGESPWNLAEIIAVTTFVIAITLGWYVAWRHRGIRNPDLDLNPDPDLLPPIVPTAPPPPLPPFIPHYHPYSYDPVGELFQRNRNIYFASRPNEYFSSRPIHGVVH